MRAYRTMIVSGALMAPGLVAVMLIRTGWEALAVALTILAGFVFLACAIVVGVEGDGPRRRGPGARLA